MKWVCLANFFIIIISDQIYMAKNKLCNKIKFYRFLLFIYFFFGLVLICNLKFCYNLICLLPKELWSKLNVLLTKFIDYCLNYMFNPNFK